MCQQFDEARHFSAAISGPQRERGQRERERARETRRGREEREEQKREKKEKKRERERQRARERERESREGLLSSNHLPRPTKFSDWDQNHLASFLEEAQQPDLAAAAAACTFDGECVLFTCVQDNEFDLAKLYKVLDVQPSKPAQKISLLCKLQKVLGGDVAFKMSY